MPNSWVNVLEVPRNSMNLVIKNTKLFFKLKCILFLEYNMLYPSGKKVVTYMNAIKEFYADYIMPDGLIEKTTFFTDFEYVNKTFVIEIYKHRIDKLISVETKYTTKENETVEYFRSGRDDFLKSIYHFKGIKIIIKLHF